jgi:hypothetical protein
VTIILYTVFGIFTSAFDRVSTAATRGKETTMQLATLDSPFVNWEKWIADGEKDEPPIECRLAVPISEEAAFSFIDFLEQHFYCDAEHLGWDMRRLHGGPDGAGWDMFATLVPIGGSPDECYVPAPDGGKIYDSRAYCDRLWKSFDRDRVATDCLVIDGMDEAVHNGWEAPADIAAAIETLRDMQSARAAERKAAEKAEEAAHEQIEMRNAAEDEWLAFGGSATGEQIDAWKEKYKRLMIGFERNLAPVTVLPFRPAPSVAPRPQATPLSLTFFDECRDRAPKHWIFKGVFAKGENSSIFGAPGTLKSAFLTDVAIHAAAGKDWRGFKSKEKCGVVYFAFERADQVRRRLAAYATRDGSKDLPIAVAGNIVDMLNPGCVDIVVATIRAAEARFGIPVGFISFDTWSKGIAAGGGDEDKARDQNIIAANLRRIHEQVSVHIAGVGHSGKDETRGERGSNARQGDVDLQIHISGDTIKTATVIKANDQPEGPLTSYAGEVVALGTDEDGDAITAFIVSARTFAAVPKASKRNPRHDLAMGALHRAVEAHGQELPAPAGLSGRAVAIDRWRDELFECGFIGHDAANPRADFKRVKEALVGAQRITIRNEYVWPVGAPPPAPPSFPSNGQ